MQLRPAVTNLEQKIYAGHSRFSSAMPSILFAALTAWRLHIQAVQIAVSPLAHPLFAEETFYEETDCEYPQEVTRIVFNSKTFGPKTYIAGDCFNLRLKNGTTLYLMDIEKSVHKVGDSSTAAKEAWMYVPSKGSQLLVASQDDTPVAPFLELLFSTVKERMEHPKVNNDVMYAIDAFMKDDIADDMDEMPF